MGFGDLVPEGISSSLGWSHLSAILKTKWDRGMDSRQVNGYPCNYLACKVSGTVNYPA
jgi:hypothetical protein